MSADPPAPGAQTRRNRGAVAFSAFIAFVGLCMVVAGLWVAAGGRGGEFDRQEELWGGLFFALCGALPTYVGLAGVIRERPPKLEEHLPGTTVAVESDSIRRGDELTVTVTSGTGRRLEVGVVCLERSDYLASGSVKGASFNVRQTRETVAHAEWQPVSGGPGEHEHAFRIPPDAPFSYEGDCVSYVWRASVRAPRRLRADARLDRPIRVRW